MKYQIVSAAKLSTANLKLATELASSKLGAKGTPEQLLDASLLAGIQIHYGSQMLDLTLSGQLERLIATL